MALRTVHVKMRTEEISAMELLAEKDRRRPAELMRFAVEEYVQRRASEVAALRTEKVRKTMHRSNRSELRGTHEPLVGADVTRRSMLQGPAERTLETELKEMKTKLAILEHRLDAKDDEK